MPSSASLSARLLARPSRKVLFRRERETGDGAPEGLPLIFRFSPAAGRVPHRGVSRPGGVSSISAMENPYPRQPRVSRGPCAVFPEKSAGSPPGTEICQTVYLINGEASSCSSNPGFDRLGLLRQLDFRHRQGLIILFWYEPDHHVTCPIRFDGVAYDLAVEACF